jgi:biotin synthase
MPALNETVSRARAAIQAGKEISRLAALRLAKAPLADLLRGADALRRERFGNRVSLCAIVNARAGLCAEDCAFCAQSGRHAARTPVYPMRSAGTLLAAARNARGLGASRFGIVASGRAAGRKDAARVCGAVRAIRRNGVISPCASLGALRKEEARALRAAGLARYHHNLETSARFFPSICATHRWDDRVRTVRAAKGAGLEICTGGIFGLGETWEDRVDLALALRELGVESVPINFLMPVRGTPLGERRPLRPPEALRIIALFRFILPRAEIRVAGGRELALGEAQERIFAAGANGMMVGDYLTARGRGIGDDMRMLERLGLEIERSV